MQPAYRSGKDTPWGGSGLKDVFGKHIPCQHTGESLEVSVIPGLESRDPEGFTLPRLIRRYGARLTGMRYASSFPLLLKLLDAKQTLSVQVHPDDAYAARMENKLGKTEAWYILDAKPGAWLVYGLQPGVTKEMLLFAGRQGTALEGMLRRVEVKAGETYFIPAGMVHAIGEGILLYEIQQSSDVTYRLYDWDREDREGNKRELHLEKASEAACLDANPDAVQEIRLGPGHFQLLRGKHFWLDRLEDHTILLPRHEDSFSILTALRSCSVEWAEGILYLPAGQTALLPADGFDLMLRCGEALLAGPGRKECP